MRSKSVSACFQIDPAQNFRRPSRVGLDLTEVYSYLARTLEQTIGLPFVHDEALSSTLVQPRYDTMRRSAGMLMSDRSRCRV